MNLHCKQLLILVLGLLLLLLLIVTYQKQMEDFTNISQIGNILTDYFFSMAQSFSQGKNFEKDLGNGEFLRDFPKTVELDVNIMNELVNNNLTIDKLVEEQYKIDHIAGTWTVINKDREKIWTIMRPIIHNILDKVLRLHHLEEMKSDDIVLHFRCSDAPFVRHKNYHLQKYSYFKDTLEKIKKKGISTNKIKFLTCSNHQSSGDDIKSCNSYNKNISEYLESLGYNVETVCKTVVEDFATMFYCRAVISTGGSFSFFGGFFGTGLFFTEGHNTEGNPEHICRDCSEKIVNGYTINHSDVTDYHNVEETDKLLRS